MPVPYTTVRHVPSYFSLPPAPEGLTQTSGSTIVTLFWTATPTATSYIVYRNGVSVMTGKVLTFADTGLINGVVYNYAVSAVNAVGEGPTALVDGAPVGSGGPVIAAPTAALLLLTGAVPALSPPLVVVPGPVGSGGAGYRATLLGFNPVGYWRFGEPSGTNVVDESGLDAGTYTSATVAQTGINSLDPTSTSVLLDGSTGYVTIPAASISALGDTFTWMMWAKRTATGGSSQHLFDRNASTDFQVWINKTTLNHWSMEAQTGGAIVESTTTLDTAAHFLAITKAGATVHMYQDGVDVTGSVTNHSITGASGSIVVGAHRSTFTSKFAGNIQEFALFSSALTAGNITSIYTAAGAGQGFLLTGAVPTVTVTSTGATAWAGSFAATDAVVPVGGNVNVPAGTFTARFTLNTNGVHWKLDPATLLDFTSSGVPVQGAGFTLAGNDIIFEGGRGTGSAGAEYNLAGDRCTILNHESDHHIEEAYVVHGADCRITGGSIHHCNETGQVWDGSEQGAGKTVRHGLIIDGVHLYSIGLGHANDSAGQGFWWDSIAGTANQSPPGTSQGWQMEVKNCLIEDVLYAGVMFEISVTAAIHHNVILRCGTTTSGAGFWGSGVLASTSSDVDVYSNVFQACQSSFRLVVQNRSDMPRDGGGVVRISDTVRFHDNVSLDPTLRQFAFTSDNSPWNTNITSVANGNQVYNNRMHGTLSYQWGSTVASTLAGINALPGGGGNSVITDAQRDAIVASFASGNVATILAAAGIV